MDKKSWPDAVEANCADLSGCLLVLQPLLDEPKFVETDIRQNYAPAEAELMTPIMRAARMNLKWYGSK